MAQFKTIQEVKTAIDNGAAVRWKNDGYECSKDSYGRYNVIFISNGDCAGLEMESNPLNFYTTNFN